MSYNNLGHPRLPPLLSHEIPKTVMSGWVSHDSWAKGSPFATVPPPVHTAPGGNIDSKLKGHWGACRATLNPWDESMSMERVYESQGIHWSNSHVIWTPAAYGGALGRFGPFKAQCMGGHPPPPHATPHPPQVFGMHFADFPRLGFRYRNFSTLQPMVVHLAYCTPVWQLLWRSPPTPPMPPPTLPKWWGCIPHLSLVGFRG